METFVKVLKQKCSRRKGEVYTKETRQKWWRIVMEAKVKAGVYEGSERRYLMEIAKQVLSKLSLAKWRSSLEEVSLQQTERFRIFTPSSPMLYYIIFF